MDSLEYQVVKLQRSSERCHLLSRIPVYDYYGQLAFYDLKFTSGNVFKVDNLEAKHIWHVITGFFHRRNIDNFAGANSVMITFPITQELKRYMKYYPVGRLIVKVPADQPPIVTATHLVSHLNHLNLRFAVDLETLLSTDWMKNLKNFEYVIVNRDDDFKEKMLLCTMLRIQAPWIKFVTSKIYNHDDFQDSFDRGATLIKSAYYEFNNLYKFLNDEAVKENLLQDITPTLDIIKELAKEDSDERLIQRQLNAKASIVTDIIKLISHYHKDVFLDKMQNFNSAVSNLGKYVVNKYLSIATLHSLLKVQEKFTNTEQFDVQIEPFKYALIRAYFFEYLSSQKNIYDEGKTAFYDGLFSNIYYFLLKSQQDVLEDQSLSYLMRSCVDDDTYAYKYYKLISAIEICDLKTVVECSRNLDIKIGKILSAYEKAIMESTAIVSLLTLSR